MTDYKVGSKPLSCCLQGEIAEAEATVPEVAAHDIAIHGSHGFIGHESQLYFLFHLPQLMGTSLQGLAR